MFVPVVDHDPHPLMPTTPARARRWVQTGKATPFWNGGVWCVRLNREPSARETQSIAVGIDPGSKKEALVARSTAHSYLHLQADAVTRVKEAVETRRRMRRARRFRKTPCRHPRANRLRNRRKLPPSTKARWQWKLRLCRWDGTFSPLEVGKGWFYGELGKLAPVQTRQGWETKQLRDNPGLKKSKQKPVETLSAHCVDAWVLAYAVVGGAGTPENTRLLCLTPVQWQRRKLHRLQPEHGGIRKPYGGTRSLSFTRGTLVKHPKYGLTYVGGSVDGRLSLHAVACGKRLTQQAKGQ